MSDFFLCSSPPEPEVKHKYCPICGKEVFDEEYAYRDRRDGTILGCENCVEEVFVEGTIEYDA